MGLVEAGRHERFEHEVKRVPRPRERLGGLFAARQGRRVPRPQRYATSAGPTALQSCIAPNLADDRRRAIAKRQPGWSPLLRLFTPNARREHGVLENTGATGSKRALCRHSGPKYGAGGRLRRH